jgi:hypothetical protein
MFSRTSYRKLSSLLQKLSLHRWYTEVPDYCDAIRVGRFAPRVSPEASYKVEACLHQYEDTMEKSYVLALPKITRRQGRFLNSWMKSHDGKTPYDPLALNNGDSGTKAG